MFSTLKFLGAAALVMAPTIAMAKPDITLTLTRYNEKTVAGPDGTTKVEREVPAPESKTVPGDPIIFVLSYSNKGDESASNAAFQNNLPRAVEFVSTEDGNATYSVDGGKSWGNLAELTVPVEGAAPRAATSADVTNIRWVVNEIAPGTNGSVSYRARVR